MERSPAESCRLASPPGVEKPTAIVNKAPPTLWSYTAWWFAWIKPRQRLGPSTRRTAVILNDRGTFFFGVSPSVVLCCCYELPPLFNWFNMFRSERRLRLLNNLNILNVCRWRERVALQLNEPSPPAI